MAKGSGLVVYKCVVCGKAWPSKQSLRAHMKAHKGEGYRTTHIVVRGEEFGRFEELCRRHNTTTCHLLGVLIRAALKGDETGMIDVGAPNPMIVNVHEYFLGKPRSAWKQQFDLDALSRVQRCCPECGSVDVYEKRPSGVLYLDGRCKKCGAEWLIKPGS